MVKNVVIDVLFNIDKGFEIFEGIREFPNQVPNLNKTQFY